MSNLFDTQRNVSNEFDTTFTRLASGFGHISGILNSPHNIMVARATAEITLEGFAYLMFCGIWVSS